MLGEKENHDIQYYYDLKPGSSFPKLVNNSLGYNSSLQSVWLGRKESKTCSGILKTIPVHSEDQKVPAVRETEAGGEKVH
jgi:hypothetical protein